MPTKKLRFQHETNADIVKQIYEYDESMKIRDMLYDFLDKTNSIKTLKPEKIFFLFGANILNSNEPNYLDMEIKEVFKHKNNALVKVFDPGKVVGGYKS